MSAFAGVLEQELREKNFKNVVNYNILYVDNKKASNLLALNS